MDSGLIVKKITDIKEVTIEDFSDYIDTLIWEFGISEFQVTEVFPKRGKYVYFIRGLHIDEDDGVVCCSDLDAFLFTQNCVLTSFLKSQVIVKILDKKCVELCFDSGYIIIQAVGH